MGVSVDGSTNSYAIIAELTLLASTAHQRASVVPQQDQVFASGWEMTRVLRGDLDENLRRSG